MDLPLPLTANDALGAAPRWSAAVFGRNEAPYIKACLHALAVASAGTDTHVTVLLNGTTDDSLAVASAGLRNAGLRGRIYGIAQADKAHAFNLFVHDLRPRADDYLFLDAYAEAEPAALRRLASGLLANPRAVAAAAVPSTGRSAAVLRRTMLEQPGLHGSLFALRGTFVDRIAALGLRLPLNLYRGDGLIGSFALHDLDATADDWDSTRIAVEPTATWRAPTLKPWRPRDLRRHWNRLVQQGRGRLQWAAIRDLLYAPEPPHGFPALPDDADQALLDWIARAPAEREPSPLRDPFAVLALRRIRRAPRPGDLTPNLLFETGSP